MAENMSAFQRRFKEFKVAPADNGYVVTIGSAVYVYTDLDGVIDHLRRNFAKAKEKTDVDRKD